MDEYIKRKEAILTVRGYAKHSIDKGRKSLDTVDDSINMCDEIDRLPAADVVPVVHGDWVRPHWRNSNFCYDCSICGNEVIHQEYRWRDKKIYPICPWCGAKMDGDADND